jgi:glycosyltransferase A (GT-A) superfamily protein (DUF2064 family)
MNRVLKGKQKGIQWTMVERLDDVDCADDIFLLTQRWSYVEANLEKLEMEAAKVGLI